MPRSELHLVTDPRLPRPALLDAAVAAVEGGVDLVRVRDKLATLNELLAFTRTLHGAIGGRARLVVTDDIELALAADADGVHLSDSGPEPRAVRTALGGRAYIGVSVHSLTGAQRAERAGADAVTFGHVFSTMSHPGEPPRGIEALHAVVQAVRIPVIAIGGIDVANAASVLAAGAAGLAVISAILDDRDPRAAAARLRARLDAAS